MNKRIVFLLMALLCCNNVQADQEQQVLPPPKVIEATPPEQSDLQVQLQQPDQSVQQPDQPGQQVLPEPKVLDNPKPPTKQGLQLYKILPLGHDIYVMIDPDNGRHPCVGDSKRDIVCRW